jgi:hypothetical protein
MVNPNESDADGGDDVMGTPENSVGRSVIRGAIGGVPDDSFGGLRGLLGGEQVEKDYAAVDAQIKQDFEKTLDPSLMQFADLLVKRFENKTEQLLLQATKRAERAEMKADEAMAMAKTASGRAANAESMAVKAVAVSQDNADAVVEQGKKIVELEKLVRDVVKKGRWGAGHKPNFVKSKNNPQLDLSPEERLAKLQASYMDLVSESNTTNRFILGRKKGMATASQDQAKAVFENFFPGVKYFILKPGNAEFFRVTVLEVGAVKKVAQGAKQAWMELGALGWWFSPDKPDQMRLLEARARDFVNYVKEIDDENKKAVGYVSTDNGVLSKAGKELLPLFLIPKKSQSTWPSLADLFLRRIDEVVGGDLVMQYGGVNDNFLLDWIEAAKLTELAADIRAVRAADDD